MTENFMRRCFASPILKGACSARLFRMMFFGLDLRFNSSIASAHVRTVVRHACFEYIVFEVWHGNVMSVPFGTDLRIGYPHECSLVLRTSTLCAFLKSMYWERAI